MKQRQSDKFRCLYNLFTEDECWERAEKSAKHILSAVAFKESSSVSFKKTGSVLLPPIGYYYSFFHMAVALCWLDPRIEKEKLEKLRHTTLQNLILDNFVNQNILSSSFTNVMQELKEEREWLNYTFGEFDYDFFENVKNNERLTSTEFTKCFEVINEICDLLISKFDIKQRIKTYIADSKGDDFVQTYLSEDEQNAVMNYMVSIGYSN
jgi:uncharacterized protein (UPF0332 family)